MPRTAGRRHAAIAAADLRQGDVIRREGADHLVVRRAAAGTAEVLVETWTREAHQHCVSFYAATDLIDLSPNHLAPGRTVESCGTEG